MFNDNCICKFLNGASVYSVQYLGWVTAVVAAILALTSIVFSQYNERSIQKSNDVARSIRNRLNKELDINKENVIKEDFNHMLYLLSNTSIYDKTMELFTYLSYFIVFLWWFSLIGYLSDAASLIDKVIICLSTLLISIPFLFLPHILKDFNKNKPICLSEKGYVKLKDFIVFFKDNTNLSDSDIILKFLSPKINIRLNSKLELNYSINSKISNLTYIIILENENERIIINLNQGFFESKNTFAISNREEGTNNYSDSTLFSTFKAMNKSNMQIYICNSLNEYTCFSGKMRIHKNEIEISPITKLERMLDKQIFESKNILEVAPALGESEKFKIK